jgi:hypothetical protein
MRDSFIRSEPGSPATGLRRWGGNGAPNAFQFGGGESKDLLLSFRDFYKELQRQDTRVDAATRRRVAPVPLRSPDHAGGAPVPSEGPEAP